MKDQPVNKKYLKQERLEFMLSMRDRRKISVLFICKKLLNLIEEINNDKAAQKKTSSDYCLF